LAPGSPASCSAALFCAKRSASDRPGARSAAFWSGCCAAAFLNSDAMLAPLAFLAAGSSFATLAGLASAASAPRFCDFIVASAQHGARRQRERLAAS
jgi:hypothetical protein